MCVIYSIRCLKPLKSFESTWQIADFSAAHVLTPSKGWLSLAHKHKHKHKHKPTYAEAVRC